MATERDDLREYLAERDVACPGCGYNLRGLTQTNCPECGRALSVGVLKDVQLTAAWWVGFAPLLGVALSAVAVIPLGGVLAIASLMRAEFGSGIAALATVVAAVWGFLLEVRWIRNAEAFVARPAHEQWRRAKVNWTFGWVFAGLFAATCLTMGRGWS